MSRIIRTVVSMDAERVFKLVAETRIRKFASRREKTSCCTPMKSTASVRRHSNKWVWQVTNTCERTFKKYCVSPANINTEYLEKWAAGTSTCSEWIHWQNHEFDQIWISVHFCFLEYRVVTLSWCHMGGGSVVYHSYGTRVVLYQNGYQLTRN